MSPLLCHRTSHLRSSPSQTCQASPGVPVAALPMVQSVMVTSTMMQSSITMRTSLIDPVPGEVARETSILTRSRSMPPRRARPHGPYLPPSWSHCTQTIRARTGAAPSDGVEPLDRRAAAAVRSCSGPWSNLTLGLDTNTFKASKWPRWCQFRSGAWSSFNLALCASVRAAGCQRSPAICVHVSWVRISQAA